MSGAATRRPTSDTARWAAASVVIGSVVGAVMVLLGMEPRLSLVGVMVLLTTAASWLISGLAAAADPLAWYNHGGATDSSSRPDRRVQLLAARLRHNTRHAAARRRPPAAAEHDETPPVDEIIGSLVSVLDDHLRAQHGIDRSTDVRGASDTLGAELARFVSDPEAARAMTQRRTLASTITLIEAFTASTTTSTGASTGHT